jgi:hypothetical protein
MTAHEPDPPTPPECAAAVVLLHRRLDGEAVILPVDVAGHVAGCVHCRERFAAAGRLSAASVPPVPADLADRILAAVLADARRRRLMRRAPFALAAVAAVIAVAVWLGRPPSPTPSSRPVPELVHEPSTPAPNPRQEFAEAGEAVASLTRRTAADAVGAGRHLIPDVPVPPWPELETAALPFEDAGQALAEGFEPVATSARRAARLFWRELPLTEAKQE